MTKTTQAHPTIRPSLTLALRAVGPAAPSALVEAWATEPEFADLRAEITRHEHARDVAEERHGERERAWRATWDAWEAERDAARRAGDPEPPAPDGDPGPFPAAWWQSEEQRLAGHAADVWREHGYAILERLEAPAAAAAGATEETVRERRAALRAAEHEHRTAAAVVSRLREARHALARGLR